MATNTWTAGAAGDASTDANWSLGRAPIAGDDVQFTNTSNYNCNWNIDVACSITLSGYTGILLLANDLTNIVSVNQADTSGYINGNTKNITASGNVTIRKLNTSAPYTITMTGEGSSIYYNGSWGFLNLIAAANITATRLFGYSLTTNAGKKLTLSGSSNTFEFHLSGSYNVTNNGSIDGDGTLRLLIRDNTTLNLGDISCPVKIVAYSGNSSDYTASLGSNTRVKNALTVISENSTYSVTLHHGSNYTLEVDGLTTLGARATMTQGTGTWTFTGGYTQNGASSVFTQGGNVSSGAVSFSNGTLTGTTSYVWTCSGDFAQSGGTLTGDKLNLKMSGTSKNITSYASTNNLWSLTIDGTITIDTGVQVRYYSLVVNASKSLTLTGTTRQVFDSGASPALTNNGEITGTGEYLILLYNTNTTITFGTFNAPLHITGAASMNDNRTITLGANTTLGSTLTIDSSHGTYTASLLHGTNYTLSVTGLTTLSTRGVMTQGTGTWTFTGGYTQSGTSSVFTQGGPVSVTGDTVISDGTLTGLATSTWTQGGNFTHTAGTITSAGLNLIFAGAGGNLSVVPGTDVLSLKVSANITLASSLVIAGGGSLIVDASKAVSIALSKILEFRDYTGATFTNLGLISGPGTLDLVYYNANQTRNLGTISCAIRFIGSAAALDNRVVTLGSSALLGSVSVSSNHASYTMTLDLAGFNLSATAITVGTRGVLTGTGTLTADSITVGASGLFTDTNVTYDKTKVVGQTITWTAAEAANASATTSWSLNRAPFHNDNVVFDGTSVNNCLWDIAATTAIPNSITLAAGYTGTVTQGAVGISIGAGGYLQEAGTFTGNGDITKPITVAGGVTKTGGTFSNYVSSFLFPAGTHTVTSNSALNLKGLDNRGTTTFNTFAAVYGSGGMFHNRAGATLSIPSGKYVEVYINKVAEASTYAGTVSGEGGIYFFATGNLSIDLSAIVIGCRAAFQIDGSSASSTVSLGADTAFGGGLVVGSRHASNTITLDLAGHSLSATAITVGTRGVLTGTGTLTADSITVGASGLFTDTNVTYDKTKVVGQTITWTAAEAANASATTSWSLNRAPFHNDNVVFDGTSVNNCLWDIAATTAIPNSITLAAGYTGTVTQGAVGISIGAGGYLQEAGTFTGNGDITKPITVAGGVTKTGGTFSNYVSSFLFPAGTHTVTSNSALNLKGLDNRGTTTFNTFAAVYGSGGMFHNRAGATLSIPSGKYVEVYINKVAEASTYAGTVSGEGGIYFFATGNLSIDLSAIVIGCRAAFQIDGSSASSTVSLGADTAFGGGLVVGSRHASNTITLDLAGHSLSATAITVGTRGVLTGTGTLTADSITVGASGLFTDTNVTYDKTKVVGQTITWTAAEAANASATTSWSLNRAPFHNDNVVFDGTSVNNCLWDIAATTAIPNSITLAAGYTGTVTQGAVGISIGAGGYLQEAGTFTGNGDITKPITVAGGVTKTGGTFSNYVSSFLFPAGTHTVTSNSALNLKGLDNRGTTTFNTFAAVYGSGGMFHNRAGATLSIPSGKYVEVYINKVAEASTYAGTVSGEGGIYFFATGNLSIDLSAIVIGCRAAFQIDGSSASSTVSLGADTAFGGGLVVGSRHASNTITLDLAGHSLSATAITVGTRGVLTQGTGTLTCSSYTQNGASSLFTQGGNITCTGDFTHTAGTFTPSASYMITCGGNFRKSSSATMTSNALRLTMTGTDKLLVIKYSGTLNIHTLIINGTISTGTAGVEQGDDLCVTNTFSIGAGGSLSLFGEVV